MGGCGALFTHGAQGCLLKMEGTQVVFRLDACATKGIDGFKDASRHLVSSGGAGDNVLPDPIEVSDIFAVDGRERSGVCLLYTSPSPRDTR